MKTNNCINDQQNPERYVGGGVHQFPCKREGGIFRMERTADGVRLLKSLPSINKALGSIPTA